MDNMTVIKANAKAFNLKALPNTGIQPTGMSSLGGFE
jgi:hypothetical protein